MPRLVRFTAAAMTMLALSGCATLNVSSHLDRGFDFATVRTYQWGPADALPTGDPRLDNNAFFHDYFQGAVEKGLALRGFARASDSPDLLIHYHASVTQEIDVAALEREYRNCAGYGCQPRLLEYEAGTLMIDVMDARTNRLVWRAWAQSGIGGVIDDQELLRKHVTNAVEKMLEKLPGTL